MTKKELERIEELKSTAEKSSDREREAFELNTKQLKELGKEIKKNEK